MAKRPIDIGLKFTGDAAGFQKAVTQVQSSFDKLKKKISTLGFNAALDIAQKAIQATRAIVNLTVESAKLAAQAEGITAAFNRLNQPNLLADLQKATRGTVDNVTLMQKAVQANNFKIPLGQLATFFEFATKRAIQTGESVDYLVNSIITGIGRKSVLVMDNLGISSVQLQQEVAKVGDFGIASGNIIRRELESMGDVADTTAIKMQQTAVAVKNLKLAWGEYVNQSKVVGSVVQWISDELTIFADKDLSLWEKLNGSPNEYKEWKERVEFTKKAFAFFGDINKGGEWQSPWGKAGEVAKEITTINSLNLELGELKKILNETDITDRKTLETTKLKIQALEEQIKKLIELEEVIKRESPISKVPVKGNVISALIAGRNKGAKLAPDMIPQMTGNLQIAQKAVDELSQSFETLFLNVGGGFKGMVNSMLDSLKLLFAKLVGKAALFGLLQVLLPGSGMAVGALTGLRSFVGIPGYASGTNYAPGGLSLVGERGPELVNLPRGSQVIPNNKLGEGGDMLLAKLRGSDIDIILKRHYSQIQSNT